MFLLPSASQERGSCCLFLHISWRSWILLPLSSVFLSTVRDTDSKIEFPPQAKAAFHCLASVIIVWIIPNLHTIEGRKLFHQWGNLKNVAPPHQPALSEGDGSTPRVLHTSLPLVTDCRCAGSTVLHPNQNRSTFNPNLEEATAESLQACSHRDHWKEGSLPWSPGRVATFKPFCSLTSLELSCDSTVQLNEPNELVLSYEAVRVTRGRGEERRDRSREDVAAAD